MSALNKMIFLGLGIFFLWLTISLPNIPELFTIHISEVSRDNIVLLQYSSLVFFVGSFWMMAMEGEL